MYELGFYRIWDAQIVYLKSLNPAKQTVTYVDVKNKEYEIPEEVFFGKVNTMVGDMSFGSLDLSHSEPYARKIEGFNFVHGSAGTDIVSLRMTK